MIYYYFGLNENLFLTKITPLPAYDNIFLTPNLECTGNIVFGKIKIHKNRDNGETTKVYYNDILIFDEEKYLEQDNQFIKIIKETNV